jgi:hypothetical protein
MNTRSSCLLDAERKTLHIPHRIPSLAMKFLHGAVKHIPHTIPIIWARCWRTQLPFRQGMLHVPIATCGALSRAAPDTRCRYPLAWAACHRPAMVSSHLAGCYPDTPISDHSELDGLAFGPCLDDVGPLPLLAVTSIHRVSAANFAMTAALAINVPPA